MLDTKEVNFDTRSYKATISSSRNLSMDEQHLKGRALNVYQDFPDARDWIYDAPLIELVDEVPVPEKLTILDQGEEGACTGFALAGAINKLRSDKEVEDPVSARMLYEMARKHDEWAGKDYSGSSLRGAIHGWKNTGVCTNSAWPNEDLINGLTLARAKSARKISLGAYYRLRPVINDYHAALQEVGVIVCSAKTHAGWAAPSRGLIEPHKRTLGGHAFTIVGFSQKKNGFWVQNSWGDNWGAGGVALWKYTDWISNVMDAWVFRLALDNSEIFAMKPRYSKIVPKNPGSNKLPAPTREQIAGHFVSVDNGMFADRHRYWSDEQDVRETVKAIVNSERKLGDDHGYKDIVIYANGGLNSQLDSARRISVTRETFKNNLVYPYEIVCDNGLVHELQYLIECKSKEAEQSTAGDANHVSRVVERLLKLPGSLIWSQIKKETRACFNGDGAGAKTLKILWHQLNSAKAAEKLRFHFIGHSTGAVFFGHLLEAMADEPIVFKSVSLLAPACDLEQFKNAYMPVLQGNKRLKISDLKVYNLREKLEVTDAVLSGSIYPKSFLYLVSNAFEKNVDRPLLGLERDQSLFREIYPDLNFAFSNGVTSRHSRATSHNGFGEDVVTMNDILKRVTMGSRRIKRFSAESLYA